MDDSTSDTYDIFISYRRVGGTDIAFRIHKALEDRGYRAFIDFEGLKRGKFTETLLMRIDEAIDFIVVLTPGSLDRTARSGSKFLSLLGLKPGSASSEDWLRTEIAYAIRKSRNVVPILANGFTMPRKADLPADIADLVDYHAMTPSNEVFDASIDRLCSHFLQSSPKPRPGQRVRKVEPAPVIKESPGSGARHVSEAPPSAPDTEDPESSGIDERDQRILQIMSMMLGHEIEGYDSATPERKTEIEKNVHEKFQGLQEKWGMSPEVFDLYLTVCILEKRILHVIEFIQKSPSYIEQYPSYSEALTMWLVEKAIS